MKGMRTSERPRRKNRKSGKAALLLILFLSVLIGCASSPEVTEALIEQEQGRTTAPGTATMMLATLPPLPSVPEFPQGLDWGYSEELDLYTLPAADCDRLLEYRDVTLALYAEDVTFHQTSLQAVINRLCELDI